MNDTQALVAFLLDRIDAIRFDPAAGQCWDEITWVVRETERAVDRSPSRVYAGPCHAPQDGAQRCQRPLYGWPGADGFVCDGWGGPFGDRGCQATHTTEGRQEWLIASIDGALVTPDELLDALPHLLPNLELPRRGVVQSWVRCGRLFPVARNACGEDTYRGVELLALIREYRPHRFAHRRRRVA